MEALKGYGAQPFLRDVSAGLVVGVVALPLAVAFAIASGADPRAGLVTAAVAGAVASLLGGSRTLVTGPTGAFVVILAAIVAEHGFAKLVVAVFLAGILLVLAGLFRLGALIKFIPYPVTTGFTAGIAVVIFLGQVPDLLGISASGLSPEPLVRLWEVLERLGLTVPGALLLAVAAVVIIQATKRFAPRVPGPVVALLVLTAVAAWMHVDAPTVGDRFGELERGLPPARLPDLDWAVVREMMPSAVTIALLGAIESLLAAVVADGMTGQRHDSNQELVAQGIANMGSALFGGLAATGAIARTATNVQNGGRSPVAGLVHAAVVFLVLYVAAPLAGLIPMAVLAGILAVVAWNMSERHRFLRILRTRGSDAWVLVAVFLLTVLIDLTVAVTVGMLLASFVFLHRMSEATRLTAVDPLRDEAPPAHAFRPEDLPEGVLVYSIDGPFFFGAADTFQETLARTANPPRIMVLRMRNVPYMDATGLNALESAISGLQKQGCTVKLSGVQNQPLDLMQRSGTLGLVGDANVHRTTPDALEHARRVLGAPAPSA